MGAKAIAVAGATFLALGLGIASLVERATGNERSAVESKQAGGIDAADLERRLSEKGYAAGAPIMIRIFKLESELELWVEKGGRFELFSTYPICNWSGVLGPKLTEGDMQSPEGLYSVGPEQLHRKGRWRRSLDIGYPNTFDKAHGRTGSFILVHGGCSTIGCYAMTNQVMDEIYTLSEAALAKGQERIQVHVFPFKMTQANLSAHASSPWSGFWANLRQAYDQFERTRVPPDVSVCANRYAIGQTMDADSCVANVSEASVAPARPRFTRYARYARLARGRRAAGRHVRRRYVAARRARMAAQARRQAMHVGGPKGARR